MSPEYQVVDIHQWLDGSLPLVDLRSSNDFDDHHLSFVSSTNTSAETSSSSSSSSSSSLNHEDAPPIIVNLPLTSLVNGERACELPPRHLKFAILIPNQYAQSFLLNNDHNDDCPIHKLFFASKSKSTLQSRIPWQVKRVLIDDKKLWKEASDMGLVTVRRNNSDYVSFMKLPRLWKPDPLLVTDILPLLKTWMLHQDTTTQQDSSYGLVWDLGCGAGRDVCYLAEEMKEIQYNSLLLHAKQQQQQQQGQHQKNQFTRSIHIVGVDNHKGSEKRCQLLWTNRNVHDVTESIIWDLNKLHLVRQLLMNPMSHLQNLQQQQRQTKQTNKPDIVCIYAVRYLNRKLFSYIANSHSVTYSNDEPLETNNAAILSHYYTKSVIHELPPPLVTPIGTIVAISHFCKPTENADWDFDHPKESNVLERFELEHMFTVNDVANVVNDDDDDDDNAQARRWHILKNDIIMDGDHGRTLIQFVARKVA